MFFKSITLSSKHWSVKLLKYVFPSLPRFYNFCPHFWLANLALIILPFLLLWKGTVWSFVKLVKPLVKLLSEWFDEWDSVQQEKHATKVLSTLSKEELNILAYAYDLGLYNYHRKRLNRYFFEDIDKRVAKHLTKAFNILIRSSIGVTSLRHVIIQSNYNSNSMEEIYNKYFNDNKKTYVPPKEIIHVKKRSWYPAAIKISKVLVSLLCIPALYAIYKLIYLFGLFIGWVWYWITYAFYNWDWAAIGQAALYILIFVATLFIIKFFSKRFSGSLVLTDWLCKILLKIGNMFVIIGRGLAWIGRGIRSVFSFFWEAIKSFKADNCPEIIWKD